MHCADDAEPDAVSLGLVRKGSADLFGSGRPWLGAVT